jgi:hypothetical protein
MLTDKELKESIEFFQQKDINILENQARKINDKQPNFTAMIYTFEMLGYTRDMTEEFLESIFVIYYAYTELLKFEINTIGEDQIAYNINSFIEFINLYNKENKHEDKLDFSKLNFIKNQVVLNYAVQKLLLVFKSIKEIPNEILFPYFALLKAIELGVENKKNN